MSGKTDELCSVSSLVARSPANTCLQKVNKIIMVTHQDKRITITVTVINIRRFKLINWWVKHIYSNSMIRLTDNLSKVRLDLVA